MRILIDIGHPAHVHLFKNIIRLMENKGHQVKVTARDKDVAIDLLEAYDIPHQVVGNKLFNVSLVSEYIYRELKILNVARKFDPDLILGTMNPVVAHCAEILDKKSIIFTDYDPSVVKYPIPYIMIAPFVDFIVTLNTIDYDYGNNSIKINSFKELAYLHSDHFIPDDEFFKELDIQKDEKYALLRFTDWDTAHHDIDHYGIKNKIELVKRLEKYGHVLITSEIDLPTELKEYEVKFSPEKLHDVLYWASLYVGDSQTTATEAALLGTPAIRCNTIANSSQERSNFIELENKYNLIRNFNSKDEEKALQTAVKFLKNGENKEKWRKRRRKLMKDKIDVSKFMVSFIEEFLKDPKKFKYHNWRKLL